jgi:tRNA wybutosine-synthesizing protein 3
VSLGLIPSSVPGWPLGVTVLKLTGGMLHVHENVKDDEMDQWVAETCQVFEALFEEKKTRYTAEERHRYGHYTTFVRCIHLERVKSYAPHLYHVVADLACTCTPTAVSFP